MPRFPGSLSGSSASQCGVGRIPRPPRLHVPGGVYHVVLRGNHREALFSTAADCRVLNEIVADAAERSHVHAFCWMSNHLHTLLQVADEPLGAIMQRIAMRLCPPPASAHETTGHLFERRYKAQLPLLSPVPV